MGKDCSSIVTTRADDFPRFPLAWIDNCTMINGYDYTCHTDYKAEVVQNFNGFKVKESHTIITLAHGNEESLDKYISEFKLCYTLLSLI